MRNSRGAMGVGGGDQNVLGGNPSDLLADPIAERREESQQVEGDDGDCCFPLS